jgi:pyruvate dehydrogenase E2 component (dihydrolipoamide acetyltransferase)
MPIEIRMPALSPTMTEGNLARWLKQEGEAINPGDVIAEIETDKATMEVEAIDEGKLGKILVAEGTEGVAVNAVIGVLLTEGEEASAIDGFNPGDGQAPAPTAAPTPAAAAAPPTAPAPAKAGNGAAGGRIFASPLAKRMAEQAGIDLGLLTGSGPHGRIIKVDIERAVTEGVPGKVEKVAAPVAEPVPTPAPLPAGTIQPIGDRYDEIPLGNIRKIVARRLTESKQTIPHY